MDNWCIVKGAENIDAAYDFINFILDPANSIRIWSSTATTPASRGHRAVPSDLQYPEMIFFTPSR